MTTTAKGEEMRVSRMSALVRWLKEQGWDDWWPEYVAQIVAGAGIICFTIIESYLVAAVFALLLIQILSGLSERVVTICLLVLLATSLPGDNVWRGLNWLDDRYHAYLNDGIQDQKAHAAAMKMAEALSLLADQQRRAKEQP